VAEREPDPQSDAGTTGVEGAIGDTVPELPIVPHPDPDPDADWWDRQAMREGALVHPVRDGEMLFIHKKRGVGAGNLVGPGGKLEGEETPSEAGIREVREEVNLEITELERAGELAFVFGEDPFMLVNVFVATAFSGTATESEEGLPEWHAVDDLPYDRMWEDDRYWVPYMLAREPFRARFRFDADGDEILTGAIRRTRTE
jgi:8-oxo-dGTP diphosphatase